MLYAEIIKCRPLILLGKEIYIIPLILMFFLISEHVCKLCFCLLQPNAILFRFNQCYCCNDCRHFIYSIDNLPLILNAEFFNSQNNIILSIEYYIQLTFSLVFSCLVKVFYISANCTLKIISRVFYTLLYNRHFFYISIYL